MSLKLSQKEEKEFFDRLNKPNRKSLSESKSDKSKDPSDKFKDWINKKSRNLEKEWG